MKAIDTVMPKEQLADVLFKEHCSLANGGKGVVAVMNKQAIISFNAGKQEGRKEVVETIKSHGGTHRITVVRVVYPETEWWSDKLKEWGIE